MFEDLDLPSSRMNGRANSSHGCSTCWKRHDRAPGGPSGNTTPPRRDQPAQGEQGQPTISPARCHHPPRTSPRNRNGARRSVVKGHKTDRIAIDREQVIEVDPACLPPDAVFKGYEDVVVQDVVFRTDNVLFHKEKFYSPAQRTTYLAPLPPGYSGQFGPGIKSLALVFYFGAQMSEPKVRSCCAVWGCGSPMGRCRTS